MVEAECGAPFPRVGRLTVQRALTGLEFAAGVPGTVGGALAMNAGAQGQSTADVVLEVTAVDAEGEVITLSREEMEFSYRTSRLQRQPGLIAVKARLRLQEAPLNDVRDRMRAVYGKAAAHAARRYQERGQRL